MFTFFASGLRDVMSRVGVGRDETQRRITLDDYHCLRALDSAAFDAFQVSDPWGGVDGGLPEVVMSKHTDAQDTSRTRAV